MKSSDFFFFEEVQQVVMFTFLKHCIFCSKLRQKYYIWSLSGNSDTHPLLRVQISVQIFFVATLHSALPLFYYQ